MSDADRRDVDIAVIGGGIAGLCTAFEIISRNAAASVVVFESASRLGGNIRTTREDGFTVEWGVNGFLDNVPETLDLVHRLDLDSELLRANEAAERRFIYRAGRLREVPLSPPKFLASGLLTLRGRLRVLGEPFARPRPDGDETVFDFAARRIGPEAAAVLVDAMVSGVYAGDSRSLSLEATFPRMAEMEAEHGSLVRAMIARRRAARRGAGGARGGPAGPAGTLTSFRPGMEILISRLAARIGAGRIRLSTPVESVARDGACYRIRTPAGETTARRVVVAAPAAAAARFLGSLDTDLASELARIGSASLAVIALAWRADDLAAVPDGFGFLAPHGQGLRILGCLWDSSIFPPRAPAGTVLLRAMIGGACDPEAVRMSDADLVSAVRGDLLTSMGIAVPPRSVWIFRHPLGIPQYNVGHGARLARIASRLAGLAGCFLVGNSYRGVAVNSCVREAAETAGAIVASGV